MPLQNWRKKRENVKSCELRHDRKHSLHIPFLKDQRPVRCHVHLLGGTPVLFQLSKTVYKRSRADHWCYCCCYLFVFVFRLFVFYYSMMCSDFLKLLSCCNMENVGIWCARAFKNIPGLVGCIEAVVKQLDDAADGLVTVVIVGDGTA